MINYILAILIVILVMISVLISLGLYDINVTVKQINYKADKISNATKLVELELKHQIEVVQATLNRGINK